MSGLLFLGMAHSRFALSNYLDGYFDVGCQVNEGYKESVYLSGIAVSSLAGSLGRCH